MSDKKLWNELRRGEKSALESIYRTYFSELYQYGKRFSVDENTVEDCIQELFIELWQRRDKLSETDAIKPYLYLSLKRKIFHNIKKRGKISAIPVEEAHFDAELSIDDIIISTEQNEEQTQRLTKAFAELSDRQKEILYLKYYSVLEYEEICQLMDLNYQSARNLVSRALQKLSKNLLVSYLLLHLYCLSEYTL